jgi:hypothetical protein
MAFLRSSITFARILTVLVLLGLTAQGMAMAPMPPDGICHAPDEAPAPAHPHECCLLAALPALPGTAPAIPLPIRLLLGHQVASRDIASSQAIPTASYISRAPPRLS